MSVAHPTVSLVRLIASALVLVGAGWHGVGWVGAAPLSGSEPGVAIGLPPGHLVVSEVQTGGASASDEFIELYNPSDAAQSLDGLEVIYVTSTGATITRKAAFVAGTQIQPGCHLLIANAAGVFAGIADLTYANGLAATGGSVAIRVIGASSAMDAVGWGTAASVWMEGSAALAPPAGQSIERLPGGSAGSGQDMDNNAVDFAVNAIPGPENAASAAVPTATPSPSPSPSSSATEIPSATPGESPTETPSPTPSATATPSESPTPTPSPAPTATPTPTPTPAPSASATPAPTPAQITVAAARALPDGSEATVLVVALTAGEFHDGGGFGTDETGGIAVLVSDGTFERGQLLRIHGTMDDRYAQRTIRTSVTEVEVLGTAIEPLPAFVNTGAIGETTEGTLVVISGLVDGAPTSLSSGLAFQVDDGSGAVRVLVGPGTGIDTAGWLPGAEVTTIGVAGQRDSSGTGTAGYRVMPRDPADVLGVSPPPTPTPSPSPTATPSPTPTPMPTPTPSAGPTPTPAPTPTPQPYISIAAARAAETGSAVRVRGVVTLPSGLVDEVTAAIADPSGAIILRLGDAAGTLTLGQWVEVTGVRSTKSGMATIRVSVPPLVLGQQSDPTPLRRPTGGISEAQEAVLVVVRGAVTAGPQRSSAGSVSLTLDDGSGPARVVVYASSGVGTSGITKGAWVEVIGVVGQQTTRAEPTSGYRIWPRLAADVRLVASATSPAPSGNDASSPVGGGSPSSSTGPRANPTAPPTGGTSATPGAVSLAAPEADASGQPSPADEQPGPTPILPAQTIPLLGSSLAAMGLLGLLMTRHGTPRRLVAEVRRRLAELREFDE